MMISSYLTWTLREIVLPLPLGIIISAITERLIRRNGPFALLRNVAIKFILALVSVSFFSCNLLLLVGVILGSVLQPVGLTGGIATGKSTVSSLMQQNTDKDDNNNDIVEEFVIIDVDGIAHDILLPNKLGNDSVYDRLVSEFGKGILVEDKGSNSSFAPNIDRRKLGDIVFQDRQKRRKLNSITHPKIIKIMLKRIVLEGLNLKQQIFEKTTKRGSRRRVVCVDIPLLFEGGLPMRLLFGTIIVVTCKPDVQLERLHKRNPDLTIEQCRHRIASQIPVQEKARKAHVVIRNDGDIKALKCQVQKMKADVGEKVCSKQYRGIELSWLLLGIMVIDLLKRYTILLDLEMLHYILRGFTARP